MQGEEHMGEVSTNLAIVSATFTRPTDTNAYSIGDLMANTTAAGITVPVFTTAARRSAAPLMVRRARLKKSTASLTLASFRAHLFNALPVITTGGDNTVLASNVAGADGYIGSLDFTMAQAFNDPAAWGIATPNEGSEIIVQPTALSLWALLEARAAYAPGNAEVFTLFLELMRA